MCITRVVAMGKGYRFGCVWGEGTVDDNAGNLFGVEQLGKMG